MARSYLDKIGLGHLWDLIKSYFVKGNARVFTGTCFSDASTAEKAVTCSEFASTDLVVGAIISVKFTNTNSAGVSTLALNVNNTGSKNIKYIYNGSLNNIPAAGYLKANQLYQFTYDGTYWVVQLVYDTNTISALRDDYGRYTAGSVGLFPYTLIMQLPDGRWESIVTSSSSGTSKTKNSHGFLINTILYKASNSTITENNKDSTWQIYEHPSVCDYRYSFNISNTTELALVAGKPIYLVGTIKADGLFYLADTWWTQTLPSTDDGKVYIYLGQTYEWYRGSLFANNSVYWYKNGTIKPYNNSSYWQYNSSTNSIDLIFPD